MRFEKGKSGNPMGGKRRPIVTEELVKAGLETAGDDRTKIRAMCDTVMNEAVAGKEWAVRFVTERLEGKVPEKIEQDVNVTTGDAVSGLDQRVGEILDGIRERRLQEGGGGALPH